MPARSPRACAAAARLAAVRVPGARATAVAGGAGGGTGGTSRCGRGAAAQLSARHASGPCCPERTVAPASPTGRSGCWKPGGTGLVSDVIALDDLLSAKLLAAHWAVYRSLAEVARAARRNAAKKGSPGNNRYPASTQTFHGTLAREESNATVR